MKEDKEITQQWGAMEYWTEELAVPLYGITDRLQPTCENNFLCVFKHNTCTFYFINGRYEIEAQTGYDYFSRPDSVQAYGQLVEPLLERLEDLEHRDFSLTETIELSREWNKVYMMTEAVRFQRFEDSHNSEQWEKFKAIAELRLQLRKKIELLYGHSNKALDTIAYENEIAKDDLFFYTYEELQQLLEQKIRASSKIILARKNGYAYWIINGQSSLVINEEFQRVLQKLQPQTGQKISEVQGRAVSAKGIVRGQVHLILHNGKNMKQQIEDFPQGSILVTEMTRPESMLVCYKAKGIITDEGGIISHAAIISRELNIPCIMGTKFATKVFHNGDEVEMNTDNGLIKIISKV